MTNYKPGQLPDAPRESKMHVALALKSGKRVASATNDYRRSRVLGTDRLSEHAETALIRMLIGRPGRHQHRRPIYTLVVYRVMKGGGFGLSQPCAGCQDAIAKCGLFRKIVYSVDSSTGEGHNLVIPAELH